VALTSGSLRRSKWSGIETAADDLRASSGTPEAFKRAMLAAKWIAYSRTGSSGIIAAKLMERLGIAEQLKDKTEPVDSVPGRRGRGQGRTFDPYDLSRSAPRRHSARRAGTAPPP
jgi:hypothetical protein